MLEKQLHAEADTEHRLAQVTQSAYKVLRFEPAHARTRRADSGQDHVAGRTDTCRITRWLSIDTEALKCITDRTDIGSTGIYQNYLGRAQSTPFVLGKSLPSTRMAWRRQRANTLKQASTM